MELQAAGTTTSTQKKIYEKPRIEIVNLVADEMVLGVNCQLMGGSDAVSEDLCSSDLCKNS